MDPHYITLHYITSHHVQVHVPVQVQHVPVSISKCVRQVLYSIQRNVVTSRIPNLGVLQCTVLYTCLSSRTNGHIPFRIGHFFG